MIFISEVMCIIGIEREGNFLAFGIINFTLLHNLKWTSRTHFQHVHAFPKAVDACRFLNYQATNGDRKLHIRY